MERWQAALEAVPADATELVPWLTGTVRKFFPFEGVLLLHGQQFAGEVHITQLTSHGLAVDCMRQLAHTMTLRFRGCFAWWLINRRPFCFDLEAPPVFATAFELDEIREFALGRVAAHGVIDATGTAGSYYSFTGVSRSASCEWNVEALNLLVPVLDELYLRYIGPHVYGEAEPSPLTPRQLQLVRMAADGMSHDDIAKKLGISSRAVRDRFDEITERLRSD